MRQFHPLASRRKDDRVIAHHIAATDRVDADLRTRSLAHDAFAPVPQRFLELELAHVGEDFEQRRRRAAGRVFLQAMVHLDDLEIEARPENLRRLAREPEKRVHAGRVVRGPDHRNLRLAIRDLGFLPGLVTGRADHQRLLPLRAQPRDRQRRIVKTEIDHRVAAVDHRGQVVAEVHLPDHL